MNSTPLDREWTGPRKEADERPFRQDLPVAIAQDFLRLPIEDGQIHVAVPAGIGDLAWIWSKWHAVAAERDLHIWMPKGEFERGHELCQLYGVKQFGYFGKLTSGMVWDYWDRFGDPVIPDTGGHLIVSANRHLEMGRRIEKWYPDLPWKIPVPDVNASIYHIEAGAPPYVVVAMGAEGYQDEGNLLPGMWARILREIEDTIGLVLLQFSQRSAGFARRVMSIWKPTLQPAENLPYSEKIVVMQNARAMLGLQSGDTMMAAWSGVPTFEAYARWLGGMPGTWHQEGAFWDWCYTDELPIPGLVSRIAALVEGKVAHAS